MNNLRHIKIAHNLNISSLSYNICVSGGILQFPEAEEATHKWSGMQHVVKDDNQNFKDEKLKRLPATRFFDKVNVPPTKQNSFWSKISSALDSVTSNLKPLNTLTRPATKPGLYWSKRSNKYPPLPFSTIVRNANKKNRFLNNDYYYY